MSLQIKIEAFVGPLDLLLHLIDKNKMNIFDIPIIEITEQYMEYIHTMETKNMDIMSEFLVMASTLLRIKSQMLLPKELNKDNEPVDPRAELVERLLEYKMYKYASFELRDRQIDADKVLFKESSIPREIACIKEVIDVDELLSDLTLSRLHSIFHSVIQKREDKVDKVRSKFGRIEKEEVNLSKKIIEIQEYGLKHGHFSFRAFLEKQAEKMEVIVSFLCVLELMKMGRIEIRQKNLFEDIEINYLASDTLSEAEFVF